MLRFILIFYFLQNVFLINASGFYSIVGPKTIRSNTTYGIGIIMHNATESTNVSVSLTGPSFSITKQIQLAPMSWKNVDFDVPKLTDGDYHLKAKGVGGVEFQDSAKLDFAVDKTWIYIQTDKAIYKPADLMQFRILFLDKRTRPAMINQPISIKICDGAQNLMKQWNDVKPTMGVFSGELQLSDQLVLGNWSLAVTVQGEGKKTKVIKVDQLMEPKFGVIVQSSKDVVASDGIIKAKIWAKYSSLKAVKGSVVVSIEGSAIEKTLPIDGHADVEFPITPTTKSDLKIVATVTEELTDLRKNGTAYVTLHQHRHKLEGRSWPTNFIPERLYDFFVLVRNVDGSPVMHSTHKVKFHVSCCHIARTFSSSLRYGTATQKMMLPGKWCKICLVTATFENAAPIQQYLHKVDKALIIDVDSKRHKLKNPLIINVMSTDDISYFMLTIVVQGNKILNKYVRVDKGKSKLVLQPTFEMIPQATIYVHNIKDGVYRFDEKTIYFEKEFNNSIEITAPATANPNELVGLKVKTDPHSFVGLLGVDQRVLLYTTDNDLDHNQIFNNLEKYSNAVVTLTNAKIYNDPDWCNDILTWRFNNNCPPKHDGLRSSEIVKDTPPSTSQWFPDTWLFSNITEVGDNGNITLIKRIPDTMTSWIVTGFSLNTDSGIAVAKIPTRLQVFRPFFITTNLPYSVKRGEVVSIPVMVYNFLGTPVEATISIDSSDKEYEIIEVTNGNVTKWQREKGLRIPTNSGQSTLFMIRPNKVGLINLKITAVSPIASDTIVQRLKVEAEGATNYVSKTILVNLEGHHPLNSSEQEKTVDVDIPPDVVEDSTFIDFKVSGRILVPQLPNMEDLVGLRTGDQNLLNFISQILALEASQSNNSEILGLAKKYLESGYHNELTYKLDDGSFSAFGKADVTGSTWITAFIIRSFHQAAKYIDIDPNVLTAGLEFLASRQEQNGYFRELGRAYKNHYETPLALTSFVLLAFYENKEHISKFQNVIDKAVQFVAREVDQSNEPYDLAIAALALQLAKNVKADGVLSKLEGMASREGDLKWWPGSENGMSDYEVTAYVLLALLEKEMNDSQSTMSIVNWLISKRNSNGRFASSQESVVALMALSKFELQAHTGDGEINIRYSISDDNWKTIRVAPENEMMLQSHELPRNARRVKFSATGQGRALVQLSYRFNVVTKEPSPSFKLTVSGTEPGKRRLVLDICVEYTPIKASDQGKPSNMALMQIQLPSGYVIHPESLANIRSVPKVKLVESKKSGSEVLVLFDQMTPVDQKCLILKAVLIHEVINHQPSWIRLHDHYDTERSVTEFYQLKSSLKKL